MMKKRVSFVVAALLLIAVSTSLCACNAKLKMNVLTGEIDAGATTSFTVLHTGDTHLTLTDERDSKEVRSYGKARTRRFKNVQEQKLQFVSGMAAANGYLLVHTGDLMDFANDANIERAKVFFDETNCLYVPGNHEMDGDDPQMIEKLAAASHHSLTFYCEEVNGVCFVGMDNTTHRVTREQLDMLKGVVQTGKPIILLLHVPLYEESLFYESIKSDGSAYLMAVPENMMVDYPKDRYEDQKADAVTYEAYEYIKAQSNIKGILAGHLHLDSFVMVGNIPQYVVGLDSVRVVTVK